MPNLNFAELIQKTKVSVHPASRVEVRNQKSEVGSQSLSSVLCPLSYVI